MKPFSSKKAKARGKPRQNLRSVYRDPPQLQLSPTFHKTLRFVNTAGADVTTPLVSLDMLSALGSIATGTLTGKTICSAFKIKAIEIWATPKSDSDGAYQSAYLEWKNSTSFSKSTRVQDMSNSNARPLHIRSSPPPLSVCDLWIHGPTVEYASLKVPTGAIIDVSVNFQIADSGEPQTVSYAVAGSVGEIRYARLDQSLTNVLTQLDK